VCEPRRKTNFNFKWSKYNIEDNKKTLVSKYHKKERHSSGLGKGLQNTKIHSYYVMLYKMIRKSSRRECDELQLLYCLALNVWWGAIVKVHAVLSGILVSLGFDRGGNALQVPQFKLAILLVLLPSFGINKL